MAISGLMAHFGELVRSLRELSGLGVKDLAARADLTDGYIRAVESRPTFKMKRSTAMAIFNAINDHRAVPQTLATEYFEAAGLESHVGTLDDPSVKARLRQAQALRDIGAEFSRDEAHAFRLLADLLDEAGPVAVTRTLEAMRSLYEAGAAVPLASSPRPAPAPKPAPAPAPFSQGSNRVISVRRPPVQKEGFVEEQVIDYELRPSKPAAARRKRGTA